MLGVNIEKIAKSKGVTRYKISKITGISQSYLGDLFKGKANNPTYEILSKIADALEVDIEELLKVKRER